MLYNIYNTYGVTVHEPLLFSPSSSVRRLACPVNCIYHLPISESIGYQPDDDIAYWGNGQYFRCSAVANGYPLADNRYTESVYIIGQCMFFFALLIMDRMLGCK